MKYFGYGSSDYGASLADFKRLAGPAIGRRTTVIILGDARNNFGPPRCELLREIHTSARRVIWLNPEARPRWDTGDSVMSRYRAHCTSTSVCNSLAHLERVVENLLLTYTFH